MSDDAARHHVGPVSNARGIVPDGDRGDAEPGQVIEPGNTRLVPSNTGVVEDSCGNAQFCRNIGGINAAMGTVDDNRSRRFGSNTGNAVGDDHRCELCDRQSPLPQTSACRSCRVDEAKNSDAEGRSVSDADLRTGVCEPRRCVDIRRRRWLACRNTLAAGNLFPDRVPQPNGGLPQLDMGLVDLWPGARLITGDTTPLAAAVKSTPRATFD